jgi:hypothetical protein
VPGLRRSCARRRGRGDVNACAWPAPAQLLHFAGRATTSRGSERLVDQLAERACADCRPLPLQAEPVAAPIAWGQKSAKLGTRSRSKEAEFGGVPGSASPRRGSGWPSRFRRRLRPAEPLGGAADAFAVRYGRLAPPSGHFDEPHNLALVGKLGRRPCLNPGAGRGGEQPSGGDIRRARSQDDPRRGAGDHRPRRACPSEKKDTQGGRRDPERPGQALGSPCSEAPSALIMEP